ncbi:DUF4376 domain-containing protein [Brucella sp. TWI559]
MSQATKEIVDNARIGTKGYPRNYEALGIAPPMKTVPVENGEPVTSHPGLTPQEYLAAKRWEKEVGGIEVNGLFVATDDRSKMMISGARVAAESNLEFATQWKTATGDFLMVDAASIIAVSDAVLDHVARCFAVEAAITADLQSGADFSIADIDEIFARSFP